MLETEGKVGALKGGLRAIGGERGAVYAEYYGALVNGAGGMNPDIAPDGIHPNAKGYAMMEPIAKAAIAEAEKTAAPR